MKQAGQIVLTPFPYTDLSGAKLRPVLMLRKASIQFDDWLVCIWKARREAELALMAELVPYLQKLTGGREISGLNVYD